MNSKKFLIVGLSLILFYALAMPSSLMASEYDQATKLTFSGPVEVPGRVLPAGTYWFTLMNSDSDRNIVQIWNEDRSQLVATILTVADYRYQPSGQTVVNFAERPGDQPEAIEAWFYPGETFGHEFIYPKSEATALAQQTQQPVISMSDEDEAVSDPVPEVDAVTPTGEQIEVSEVIQSESTSDAVPASLPQTASMLPVWTLLGLVTIGASFGFRRMARNVA